MEEQSNLLRINEAADLLNVSRPTIYKWAREGRLTILKIGANISRIRKEDVERLINEAKSLY